MKFETNEKSFRIKSERNQNDRIAASQVLSFDLVEKNLTDEEREI